MTDKMTEIQLPLPQTTGTMSLEEAIRRRRSIRRFRTDALTPQQLSQLLWAAQGVTDEKRPLRSAPSAGATYPLDLYAVTGDGVYLYLPGRHALSVKMEGDRRPALCTAALGQGFIQEAALDLVVTMVLDRISAKYGDRADRYAYIEAGHTAQNVHLQAVALGLASVPVAAFRTDEVRKAISVPAEHRPVYLISVGYPK